MRAWQARLGVGPQPSTPGDGRAVGILSKTTRRHDQLVKVPYYAEVGVAHAWIVDLEARVLTAQRLESGHWVTIGTYSDETEVRIPPFDAVPLHVASWWPPGPPDSEKL
jgi:hypothetical protein